MPRARRIRRYVAWCISSKRMSRSGDVDRAHLKARGHGCGGGRALFYLWKTTRPFARGTVVLSARDCFGGRLCDSPRNDVQGETLVPGEKAVVVCESGAGRVRSVRRCRLLCRCPFPTSWRANAKPSLGMVVRHGNRGACRTRLLRRWLCHAPRNDVVGEWRWCRETRGAGRTRLLRRLLGQYASQ